MRQREPRKPEPRVRRPDERLRNALRPTNQEHELALTAPAPRLDTLGELAARYLLSVRLEGDHRRLTRDGALELGVRLDLDFRRAHVMLQATEVVVGHGAQVLFADFADRDDGELHARPAAGSFTRTRRASIQSPSRS